MRAGRFSASQRQSNLIFGLSVLLIPLAFLSAAVYFIALRYAFDQNLEEKLVAAESAFKESIELQGKASLSEALLIATNSKVKSVYSSLKKKVGDLKVVSGENVVTFKEHGRLLRDEVEPWLESEERIYGVRPKVRFYLPGPRSFVKTWQKRGEDVELDDALNSSMVVEAQKDEVVKSGLEFGSEGLVYKVVAPIVIEGEVYGSVELSKRFDVYLKTYLKNNSQVKSYAVVLKKDIESTTRVQEGKATFLSNAVLYDKSENLTVEAISEVVEKVQACARCDYDGLTYVKVPLKSYDEKDLGFVVLGLDFSNDSKLYWSSFGGAFSATVLFLLFYTITFFRDFWSFDQNHELTNKGDVLQSAR